MGESVMRTAGQVGRSVVAGGAGALLAGTTTDLQNPAYEPNGNAQVDPRMAQIPTGISGSTASGAPGAGPTTKTEPHNFYADTEAGRNIGNLASAASMIPGVGLLGKAAAPASAAMSAVGGFGAQVRADRGAPAAAPVVPQPVAAAPPPAAVAPVAAAAPPPVVASVANQGAALPIGQPNGAVTRVGNSYSGQNVSGDITINGKAPTKGGFVSGTGDGTFTYGGTGGGSGSGGGVSDQGLVAARMAAAQRGDVEGLKASYAAQGQSFGPKVDPIDALINNGRPMTTRKAAAIAALQAAAADQAGKTQDRQLAREKFGFEKSTAGISAKGILTCNGYK
jgi:hypothetical protein